VPFAFVKFFVQISFFMIAIICPSENTKNAFSPVASALCLCEKCCSDCILYDCNYFPSPPPLLLPTFLGKKFQVHALFIPKCPLKPLPPQSFDAPMPLIHTPPPSQPAISQYMGGVQI
jgi:hypothetical protein